MHEKLSVTGPLYVVYTPNIHKLQFARCIQMLISKEASGMKATWEGAEKGGQWSPKRKVSLGP